MKVSVRVAVFTAATVTVAVRSPVAGSTLPATGVPRTYRARTFGRVSQAQLEDLMDGIEIEGVRYGPINANLERSTGQNQWVELTLTEGKNREVRRVLRAGDTCAIALARED